MEKRLRCGSRDIGNLINLYTLLSEAQIAHHIYRLCNLVYGFTKYAVYEYFFLQVLLLFY